MDCIVYEKPKLAALLFDRLIPIPTVSKLMRLESNIEDFPFKFHEEFYGDAKVPQLIKLLPDGLSEEHLTFSILLSTLWYLNKTDKPKYRSFLEGARIAADSYSKSILKIGEILDQESDKVKFWQKSLDRAVLSILKPGTEIFGTCELAETIEHEESAFVEMSGLPNIDESKIEWDQIFEVRKDKIALRKLRRLRTFIIDNYHGKSKAYIEDDLMTRIDDYEDAATSWGLETVKSIFSVGGSQKLFPAVGTGLFAAFCGASGMISAGTGAIIALGSVLIQIRNSRKLFEMSQTKDPVRYLIDLQDMTKKD